MRALIVFFLFSLFSFAEEEPRVRTEHAEAVSNPEPSTRTPKRTPDEKKVSRVKPGLCFGTVFWKEISEEDEELWFKSEIGIEYPLDANHQISEIEKYAGTSHRIQLLNCFVSGTEEKIIAFDDFVNLTEQKAELATKKTAGILLPTQGRFANEDISGRGYVMSNVVRAKDGSVSFSLRGLKTESYTCKESNKCVREDGKYTVTLLSTTKFRTEEGVFSHAAGELWKREDERRKELVAEEKKYADQWEAEARKEREARERQSACEERCRQKYRNCCEVEAKDPIGRMRPYADADSMRAASLLIRACAIEQERCLNVCK